MYGCDEDCISLWSGKIIRLGIVEDKMHQMTKEVILLQSIAKERTPINENVSVIRKEVWNFIKAGRQRSHLHVLWESQKRMEMSYLSH